MKHVAGSRRSTLRAPFHWLVLPHVFFDLRGPTTPAAPALALDLPTADERQHPTSCKLALRTKSL